MKLRSLEIFLGIFLGWVAWGALSAGDIYKGAAAGVFALVFICAGIVEK